MSGQGELFPASDLAGVLWFCPVDQYGRQLPAIAVLSTDRKGWNAGAIWARLAVDEANRLGPDAAAADLYHATTAARHAFYAVTGDRCRLEAEWDQHFGPGWRDRL